MESKKILVISSCGTLTPSPDYSGLEQLAYLTARELAKRGHEVGLIGSKDSLEHWGKKFYSNDGWRFPGRDGEVSAIPSCSPALWRS